MFVFMESERLWYRTIEIADAATLGRWINDERVRRHLFSASFPFGLEVENAYTRHLSSLPPQPRTEVRLLFGRKGDALEKPIGAAGIKDINWIVARGEWGIQIGEPEHWGKGYGREVAARFLKYAFETLNLNRMQLRVSAGNVGGIKAYEAAGYRRESLLRSETRGRDGGSDTIQMAVLREEWQNKRGNHD
ncbi:MAG: GNAT family N-acetyltransferase [Planctomycetes bacterium]|nr:GNAT family N-acetyltransferase [Planctomycetota bacterium]